MGIFSRFFLKTNEKFDMPLLEEKEGKAHSLLLGMPLLVYRGKVPFLSGELRSISRNELVIEPKPKQNPFPICDVGTEIIIRGFDGKTPFFYKGTVEESSKGYCVITDLGHAPQGAVRQDFRLQLQAPVILYNHCGFKLSDSCQLINISVGGACFKGWNKQIALQPRPGDSVRIRVQFAPNILPVTLTGVILREERLFKTIRYAIQFEDLDPLLKDKLTRTIFAIDAERRQR